MDTIPGGKLNIYLASGSPRRTALLTAAGIEHVVMPSGADENIHESDPAKLVEALSAKKAEEVYERLTVTAGGPADSDTEGSGQNIWGQPHADDFIVIGADTVVALDGMILGKPHSQDDAARMLRMISGRTHHVYTGVTLHGYKAGEQRRITFHEETAVHVVQLSDDDISGYISTGEPMDKAGAYGIQGAFMKYVSGIEGDYFNIVGLPVCHLYSAMKGLLA